MQLHLWHNKMYLLHPHHDISSAVRLILLLWSALPQPQLLAQVVRQLPLLLQPEVLVAVLVEVPAQH